MTSPKQVKSKKKKCDGPSVEEYYQNKNFEMPREKTLETIFEEPKTSKTGGKQFTSMKKLKRFVQFNDFPSTDKLRKRRKRAKKFAKTFFDLTERPSVDIRYLEPAPSSTIPSSIIEINKRKSLKSRYCKDSLVNRAELSPHIECATKTRTDTQAITIDKDLSSIEDEEPDETLCCTNTHALLQSAWL